MQEATIKEQLKNKAPLEDPKHFHNRFEELKEKIDETPVQSARKSEAESYPDIAQEVKKKYASVKNEFEKYYSEYSDIDKRASAAATKVKTGLMESWNTLIDSIDKAKGELQQKNKN